MGRKVTLVFAMRHYAGNALKREGIKMGDALDEIFEQTSLRANEGTRRGGKGYRFNLSPNLEHTAVQRKKKKASAPAPSDGKPEAPSSVSKRNSASLGRLIPTIGRWWKPAGRPPTNSSFLAWR